VDCDVILFIDVKSLFILIVSGFVEVSKDKLFPNKYSVFVVGKFTQ
jgi:hypothetical protein